MRQRKKIILICWSVVAVLLYLGVFALHKTTPENPSRFAMNDYLKKDFDPDKDHISSPMQFALVTCFKSLSKSSRQFRQIAVLLKSMALLTSKPIQMNIVSTLEPMYDAIPNITASWPEIYRKRIIFGKPRHYFYPRGIEHLKYMSYRTCSSAKAFLADVFPDMDAIVALDTDMLFMNQPEDLWEEFGNFEENQIIGSAPCLARYDKGFKRFPVYGLSGLNTGMIMMNLTRIRNFPKGYVKTIKENLMIYNFSIDEQDILTNFFSRDNEKYLYEVGCEWNYRATVCERDYNRCSAAASRGISLLHGCDGSFQSNREITIKKIFRAWQSYQLGTPIENLIQLLDKALDLPYGASKCKKISNINDIYLKGLKRLLKQKGYIQ